MHASARPAWPMRTLAFALLLSVASAAEFSIEAHGAVAGTTDSESAAANGYALFYALKNASAGDVVVVPAGLRFDVIPCCTLVNLKGVSLRVDGALAGHDCSSSGYDKWPLDGHDFRSILKFEDCEGLRVSGAGAIDGQGHHWWWSFALNRLEQKRPLALEVNGCSDVVLEGLAVLDSPRFNVFFGAFSRNVRVRGVTILCDWESQQSAAAAARRRAEALGLELPMFPFNTDGIDVAGADILVEDSVISNWDDVIAVKPADSLGDDGLPKAFGEDCTRNVTVRNLTVYRGAGLSVGSVHPSTRKPCVDGVLFEDIVLYQPTKGPYVKPDLAGSDCDGLGFDDCAATISDVVYRSIKMTRAVPDAEPPGWAALEASARARALDGARAVRARFLADVAAADAEATAAYAASRRLEHTYACSAKNYFCMEWPLFLGTQQQLEPDGSGSGIWAQTEPRVAVSGVTFSDVKAHGGTWPMSAAVVRCNASKPCADLVFDDVVIDADVFATGRKYVCDGPDDAAGAVGDGNDPDPSDCVAE